MRYSRIGTAVALLALAGPAAAQVDLSGTVGVSSASVFRGVTDTNRPVLEVDAAAESTWMGLDLVAGGWLAAEPKAYRGPDELSLLGEDARAGVTQGSLWLDGTRTVGLVSATLGVTGYLYPAAADLAATYNTVELYGSLWLDVPLSPSVTLYHDIGKIDGAYLEGAVERALLSFTDAELVLGAAAGWSLGQATGEGQSAPELGYFAANGLTHTELLARASRDVGALSLATSAHLIFARDEYARVVAPDRERTAKFWLGLSIGWSSAARRASDAERS